ncbi:hypothetical protein UFOVP431_56 [uncultured Caudovirales phage]|uniref:Uncharacterized protein n=1 Tax=uncultured Caudovirales phage TaxID=2100421 RepID=A0A6J5MQB6_9CAUD|nr:hypothetical protein UFOVP431_56 [uncultured Caudovirales phage]
MSEDLLDSAPPSVVASLRNSAPQGIRDAGVTRELWLINAAYGTGLREGVRLATEVQDVPPIAPSAGQRLATAIQGGDERLLLRLLGELLFHDK